MCLAIPSKVVEISEDRGSCVVDTMGIRREANLMMVAEEHIEIGDYVLLHIGFVMNKIDEAHALESIGTYEEILKSMEEEERREAILEDDACTNRAL